MNWNPCTKKLAFANAKDFTQTLLETRVFVRGDATGDQIPGAASMNSKSIASALPSLWLVVAVCAPSLRGLDAVGLPFLGGDNMPPFSRLAF